MTPSDEALMSTIDDHILDALQLIRARWNNFNQIPKVDQLVRTLYEAYGISGYICDYMDKGWIK